MVAAMDENIGRLLDALHSLGLDKNTWVFFTSDNGGLSTLRRKNAPTSNYPLRAGKGWCYEGGIRVPMIVKGPGIYQPGRIVDQPAVSMDIFSTILALAGNGDTEIDGINLDPLLRSNVPVERDVLFWYYPHYHGSGWRPGSALRADNWKLIKYYEDNSIELYDLKSDPGERKNMAGIYPGKASDLEEILMRKIEESQGRLPVKNSMFIAD
jgi:arylsulfatase A-like enzyme